MSGLDVVPVCYLLHCFCLTTLTPFIAIYDAYLEESVAQRIFFLLCSGDMPALSMLMSMKGHTGKRVLLLASSTLSPSDKLLFEL